jgi:predicted nucleic acid-binding protein
MVAETARGKALRRLIPVGADLAVPEHFYVEVAGVLRRWEHANVLTAAQAAVALEQLVRWPLRRATVVALLPGAWAYRHNLTIGDGLYVELADRLGASLLTDDHRLVNAPTFPAHIPTLTIP